MEKIFELGLPEQIEALKKELDLERENSQVDRLAAEKEIKNLKWIKDHDYIFLVDENKKLHKEVRELKEDNKKLAQQIEDRINQLRESGF
tara:strand:+ start:166 stop:435 length:270 start_codon:yes stop_codon:yes gene_type:complete